MQIERERTLGAAPLPPGRFGLPLLGETMQYLLDPRFVSKRQQQYGRVFKTHIFGSPTVVVVGPEAARFVLADGRQHFTMEKGWPKGFQRLFKNSIATMDGPAHQRIRKAMAPAFHGQALAANIKTLESATLRYLTRWERLGRFDLMRELRRFTLEIASIIFLGRETSSDEEAAELSRLYKTFIGGGFTIPVAWDWTPLGRALKARDRLLADLDAAVRRRMEMPGDDLLGLLVQYQDETGRGLSLEEIKAQMLVLVMAGHETTMALMGSLAMVLAQRPKLRDQLMAEQLGLGLDGGLTLDDLEAMPLLDMVLREVERRYSPAGGGWRWIESACQLGQYSIPKGWKLHYRITETHLDPALYDLPEEIRPERWAEDADTRSGYSFLTYGGGPRTCLGNAFARMEIKILFSHLLRGYTWTIPSEERLAFGHLPTVQLKSLPVCFLKS